MKEKRFKIVGKVQGVGCRYSIFEKALELKLYGFVRNNRDGSVSGRLQFTSEVQIQEFRQFLERGPGLSRVDHIDMLDIDPICEYTDFSIAENGVSGDE